jgi:outer membrane protein TolC
MAGRAVRHARPSVVWIAIALVAQAARAAPVAERDTLELRSLIEEALAAHPTAARAHALESAAKERVPKSSAWENPFFRFALDDQPVDGNGSGSREFGLTQRIPFPGRTGDAGDAARGQAEAAREMTSSAEREIVAWVKEAYWTIFAIDRRLEVLRETRSTLEDVVATARARYETGLGGQQDFLLALVESGKVQGEVLHAEALASGARSRMNRLVGRDPDAPVGYALAEEPTPFDASLDALVAQAEESRPKVRAAQSEIVAADAELRLARAAWRPDLEVGAMYRWRPDDIDEWRASVGVGLPIWKSRKENAASREAQGRLEAARYALDEEKLRAALSIEEEFAHVVSERKIVELYRREVLPQAAQATASARAAYSAGSASFLSLLEAIRGELELRALYYETFADAEMHLARLEEAVGGGAFIPEDEP